MKVQSARSASKLVPRLAWLALVAACDNPPIAGNLQPSCSQAELMRNASCSASPGKTPDDTGNGSPGGAPAGASTGIDLDAGLLSPPSTGGPPPAIDPPGQIDAGWGGAGAPATSPPASPGTSSPSTPTTPATPPTPPAPPPTSPSGSGSGTFDPTAAGIWHDPQTGLYWENPPQNVGTPGMRPNLSAAQSYCTQLALGGATGWRLPTIDELRSLVRGISPVMSGGACPTSEACADADMCNKNVAACLGCTAPSGMSMLQTGDCGLTAADVSSGKCYWAPGLEGECTAYWSGTKNSNLLAFGQASYYLRFENGIIRSMFGILGDFAVRCVRSN